MLIQGKEHFMSWWVATISSKPESTSSIWHLRLSKSRNNSTISFCWSFCQCHHWGFFILSSRLFPIFVLINLFLSILSGCTSGLSQTMALLIFWPPIFLGYSSYNYLCSVQISLLTCSILCMLSSLLANSGFPSHWFTWDQGTILLAIYK